MFSILREKVISNPGLSPSPSDEGQRVDKDNCQRGRPSLLLRKVKRLCSDKWQEQNQKEREDESPAEKNQGRPHSSQVGRTVLRGKHKLADYLKHSTVWK